MLAIPGLVGGALDPLIGVLGDGNRRRSLILGGGTVVALSLALTSASTGFWLLLGALILGNPATGAFVSLAQATLMDLDPERRERNMARWTLAGSVGLVAGSLALATAVALGLGWRAVMAALAVGALALTLVARRAQVADWRSPREGAGSAVAGLRYAAAQFRRMDVLRWLAALEAADLMLDVLHGFLALYFVDVAGTSPVEAAFAVAIWTGAGLVGAGVPAALGFVAQAIGLGPTMWLLLLAPAALFAGVPRPGMLKA